MRTSIFPGRIFGAANFGVITSAEDPANPAIRAEVDVLICAPGTRELTGGICSRAMAHWRWGFMAITIVRLGSPRSRNEGVRIGTVRRPPRGVLKSDFAWLNYYDVWFPNLSPTPELVQEALTAKDQRAWAAFTRKFKREMNQPEQSRELDVLAALSRQTNFSVGCYCEDENRCHRSVLRELLTQRGADVV